MQPYPIEIGAATPLKGIESLFEEEAAATSDKS
jgi:hypothetical protein